ncbi:endo alpha-1,4 polygalactosaminidase [Psychrilyobacter sp.]|uniref:endo alpha-1,4 polygalactosaminidase n=1 Tax=Psychrilyobacter sp. TaxID=2586924 RepID=UPI0030178769
MIRILYTYPYKNDMKNLIFLISFIMIGINSLGIDEKAEMKNLILKIRDESPKNFIIIPQNGTNIYFQKKGEVDKELLGAVDGITQESLFYGYPKYGEKTPYEGKKSLLKNLKILKSLDKVIMTVNYTNSNYGKWRSKNLAEDNSFLNYCPKDREVTEIVEDVFGKNTEDITSLSHAKNFLYLLNPEKFRHRAKYIDVLSKTTYDVLIIDLYFKGIELTKDDLDKLRVKPQGGRRLIIGYFSVGEAEEYREYWKEEWDKKLPEWILYENKNWGGNYIVKYWSKEWRGIIEEMLIKYIDTGFDGVFLDTIDTYESFGKEE